MGIALPILQAVMPLLSLLLNSLTKSKAPGEIIQAVQEAIKQINMVHGTVVTKAQVDALLDEKEW